MNASVVRAAARPRGRTACARTGLTIPECSCAACVERQLRETARGDDEIRALDGWRCTAPVMPRVVESEGEQRSVGAIRRCPVRGSEVVVFERRTLCPHHMRERMAELVGAGISAGHPTRRAA